MKFLSELKNKKLSGKTCLLRVDFNIENKELLEKNLRIQAVLPTIKFLISRGVRVVILSHRGRPAEVKSLKLKVKSFSLRPFAAILSKLLNKPVKSIDFSSGVNFGTSDVLLLENLRFLPGEERNDKNFAKKLASLGDFYINDAFAVSHRKDASMVAITKFLPSYAGFCMENEIKNLSKAMRNPKKPMVIVLGGGKVREKLDILKPLIKKAQNFLIGGDFQKELPFLRKMALESKVVLPIDWVSENGKIMDIGSETIKIYAELIKNAKTIIWNGPMGLFENPKFSKGTKEIAAAILKSHAFSIIGGGETTSFVLSIKYKGARNNFISTGGGAMLEYLSGKKLPGITALK